MPRGRPPKVSLELREAERSELLRWSKRPKSSNGLAQRARIVLRCADGLTSTQVATELRLTVQTVCKWRNRFAARGPAGLLDEPRSGAPRKISDEKVEEVLTQTLEAMPRDATHWSTRSMAERSGLSPWTVREIWRAFGLQPHRTETFKLSNDPQFIEKVRDIVGLYLDPPERALVLCVLDLHQQATSTRHSSQHPRPGGRDPPLPRRLQREAEALRLGQDGRRYSRQRPALLFANFPGRTLVANYDV